MTDDEIDDLEAALETLDIDEENASYWDWVDSQIDMLKEEP